MEESGNGVVDTDNAADGAHARRGRSKWLRVPLYLLAAIGALVVAVVIYARMAPAKTERASIDEAAVIDNVMTDNYGKYSEAKRGWLYVGEDNRTYLMRVVQQTRIADRPEGDELYFIASGAAIDGTPMAMLGAFYVHPNPDKPGELVALSLPGMHGGSVATRPEDVHFEALSEQLWGWVVKVKEGSDPKDGLVAVNNVVLAPRGNDIVKLAEFPASREYDIGADCQRAHESNAAASAPAPAAQEEGGDAPTAGAEDADEGGEETEPEVFDLCQKRRWTYRTGTVNGAIPVPITVAVSGTFDGQPVQSKTWKLVFDSKAFRYNVPEDLSE
ncbi:MAG: hypothetical protein ACLGI6_08220 [Gammaproteobacteria bacterium]